MVNFIFNSSVMAIRNHRDTAKASVKGNQERVNKEIGGSVGFSQWQVFASEKMEHLKELIRCDPCCPLRSFYIENNGTLLYF